MAIQAQTFDRWGDILDAVTMAMEAFEARWRSPSAVPFFRGHSSTSYTLAPGLFRPKNGLWYSPYDEANLYYEFRSRAGPLLQADFSSWDILFCMQHHGLPTRLLDWTESFATALFFALEGAKDDIDIWLLDPYAHNQETCGIEEVLDVDADLKGDYFHYFVERKLEPRWKSAVAIYPCRRIPRLLGQSGVFTIHRELEPIENTAGTGLSRFRLGAAALNDARRYLKVCGVNDFLLFPDLDGLSQLLRKRFPPQNPRTLWK